MNKQPQDPGTGRQCPRCLRQLPIGSFRPYPGKRRRDSYCDACRREYNRLVTARRRRELLEQATRPEQPGRLVITREENPVVRKALILRALRRVEERKTNKLRMKNRT
jgi:hypothetical protein